MDDLRHNLKTPLTIILGSAQVLRLVLDGRGVLDEEDRALLHSIEDQAIQLDLLITQLIQSFKDYERR